MYEKPSWYSAFSEDHQKETKWALNQYWSSMSWGEGELVLDIGCGPGDSTRNVLLPAIDDLSISRVVGVDKSPEMIAYAQANWSHPKLSYQVLDIATKEDVLKTFNNEKQFVCNKGFDKIFSFFCLQWVKDQKTVAENMFKLLRPGGQGYILLVVRSGVYNVWDQLAESEKWSSYLKVEGQDTSSSEWPSGSIALMDKRRPLNPFVYMDDYEDVVSKFLKDAGFVIDKCETIERKDVFLTKTDSDEEKTLRLRSVDPFVSKIPEDLKKEYLQDLLEKVKSEVSPRGATDYTGLHILFRKPSTS